MKNLMKIGILGLFMILLTGCTKLTESPFPTSADTTAPKTTTPAKEPSTELDDIYNSVETLQIDSAPDMILAIDAGHGGGYTGASYNGKLEKELTLKMAFYVKEYLEQNYSNIQVHLVREKDSALSGDVAEDLELRAQFAKDVNADVLISLHFNASDSHDQNGSMVFVSNRSHVNEDASQLASSILEELEFLGLTNQGVRTRDSNDMFDDDGKALDYYAINRHCAARDIPGIIVEHCFMDHVSDQKFIDSEEDLLALAQADAIGIANYFGLSKSQ